MQPAFSSRAVSPLSSLLLPAYLFFGADVQKIPIDYFTLPNKHPNKSAAIHRTRPIFPYAMNVTSSGTRSGGPSAVWRLHSNHTAGLSASCSEAHAGNGGGRTLGECRDACAADPSCNTINYLYPSTCFSKMCRPDAGEPLVTKDGGYDVWVCEPCEVPEMQQWRLTRKGDAVFAMLLIENSTLPRVTPLLLPFVVDAEGGIDGSWPSGTVSQVTLLGGGGEVGAVVPHGWSQSEGLEIHVESGAPVSEPYAAVFQLDFGK